MDLPIKNGTILTTASEFTGDIYTEGETTRQVGTDPSVNASRTVDASGKYVMPREMDEHVRYGSFDRRLFETAGAAAAGGTTTIVDFTPQEKDVPLLNTIRRQTAKAEHTSSVDFAFHAIIMDSEESIFGEVRYLPEVGVATLKFFMAYKGTAFYCGDEAIFSAMMNTKDAGITMMVHAENADTITILTRYYLSQGKTAPVYHYYTRPPIAEKEATGRAAALAGVADYPLFVIHVSIREAIEVVGNTHSDGWPIFGETYTHYLTLTTDCLGKPGFEGAKYICSPSLRPQERVDTLWQAMRGGWLTIVGSDHCALDRGYEGTRKKDTNFSNIPDGCPGVQDRLVLLWTYDVCAGKITRRKFAELFAANPAKVVGLPNRGGLRIGTDADAVIFDPEWKGVITNKDNLHGIDYKPFEGFEIQRWPQQVLLRNRLVTKSGGFVDERDVGHWQRCKPYGLYYDHYHK